MLSEFFTPRDLELIKPAMLLALFGCGILLTDLLHDARHKYLNAITALLGLGFTGIQLFLMQQAMSAAGYFEPGVAGAGLSGFNGAIVVDAFALYFNWIFLIAAAIAILFSVRYLEIEKEQHGEYYALILFSLVGMYFLATGTDLITLFIGLETMALSVYVLAGFLRGDRRSNEAAMKYLILGAFSSGILVFGFSLLYGIGGSTNIHVIGEALARRPAGDVLVILALVTTATGLLFKVAAVPFHQWAPDVYEGAPTSITGFMSTAPKAAAFAFLIRMFLVALGPIRPAWEGLLAAVAVMTMTLGNFAAISQNNTKRLFAYSSISHVGYMLLGLVAGNETGLKGILIYLLVYAFMNLGAFTVLVSLRRKNIIGDEIEDLSGLFFKNPGSALMMLIFLLSLAGIPPTAGFLGKYFIFLSLIESGHYYLAVFAVLYVVVALYYYFRMVVMMFMREETEPERITVSPGIGVALGVTLVMTLVIGIYPEPFVRLATGSLLVPFR
jgi:NADH-quinone oxidoreductase subunit N